MTLGFILAFSFLFGPAANPSVDSWQCRNDIEIRCDAGKCQAEESFTPMSVSFDDAGKMSVCAYSGCWEGKGTVFNSGDFLMLSGQNLKFSTADSADMNEDIAITFDRKDNVALLKAGSFAQPLICEKDGQSVVLPGFGSYSVEVFSGKPKPITFSGNRDARMFRTRLNDALKGGVNFAGQYIFASWGCGTGCVQGAIIDSKTGVVYFPDEIRVMTFGLIEDGVMPLQFKKDSRLFILNGTSGEEGADGTSYLVWEGTKFKQVKFVSR